MNGITKTEKFELIGESWRKWDSAQCPKRATLKSQCGYMLSYTAYSPDGKTKIHTKLLKFISGGSYLSNFDNLSNISHKEYKKLERRARECAQYHGINFNESCFISSCGVAHGFYFPNSNKGYEIHFCRGEAVLLNDEILKAIEAE